MCVLKMNYELINKKDEIISVNCADCHQQTIYLKIMNAAKNTRIYQPQRLICAQCRLTNEPPNLALKKQPQLINESA